ncbi:MAG: YwmB family TATA-box binding protein [Lachnospiraceae bacterium]|nr:YwmB family TATA-box binding protein [Lachnospiraceae bacterium]
MRKRKFILAAAVTITLWLVVLIQIFVTRLYVSGTDFTQAFAKNQLVVTKKNTDTRNVKEGNTCIEGQILGKMSRDEMVKLSEELFRTMGGGSVLESSAASDGNYYVAYGYTVGIPQVKQVNGKNINLNVAISYDEKNNRTNVIMGTPLINSDF